MARKRVLFWVQSNLGSGHAVRAAQISSAMAKRGMDVTVVAGGRHTDALLAAGISVETLPTVVASAYDIRQLEDEDGRPVTEDLWRLRHKRLADLVEKVAPAVFLTETFPFGRTAFRYELLPVLRAARAMRMRPRIAASVRDILVTKRNPQRNREMMAIAKKFYDCVLVHGDPRFVRFDATFPHAKDLANRLVYTGYVVETFKPGEPDQRRGIVVSAGGGAVGRHLIESTLLLARRRSSAHRPWHVIVGAAGSGSNIARWQANASEHTFVHHHVKNLGQLIAAAEVSVSQAGYNTVIESLSAQTAMVLVPYEANGEDEQLRRARRSAEQRRAIMLRERDLAPATLWQSIEHAARLSPPPLALNVDGADVAASIVCRLAMGDDAGIG